MIAASVPFRRDLLTASGPIEIGSFCLLMYVVYLTCSIYTRHRFIAAEIQRQKFKKIEQKRNLFCDPQPKVYLTLFACLQAYWTTLTVKTAHSSAMAWRGACFVECASSFYSQFCHSHSAGPSQIVRRPSAAGYPARK